MNEQKETDLNGQGSVQQNDDSPISILYPTKESALAESKSRLISKDGTIIKPFLIDGGHFIVEVNVTDGVAHTMFSIRGVIDSNNISDMFQTAEGFLRKVVSDSKHSNTY